MDAHHLERSHERPAVGMELGGGDVKLGKEFPFETGERRLQMMARVQLDASHVSRSVTARREKVTRYIRVLNELSEVRTFRLYSLRLRVIELTVREDLHGSCFS